MELIHTSITKEIAWFHVSCRVAKGIDFSCLILAMMIKGIF